MDLLSNLGNGDLIVESGDLQIAGREQSNGQRILSRLTTFVGEWFLDLTFGVDYLGDILVKTPQIQLISGILKEAILQSADDGSVITTFSADFDASTRALTTEYEVRLDGDEQVSGQVTIG